MRPPLSHLQPEEWDFRGVPDDELAVCRIWEYARESETMLSIWRRSMRMFGRDWPLEKRKEQAGELQEATGGALADLMAEVFMARLLRAYRNWDGKLQSRSGQELNLLRGLCREAGDYRRASHSAVRLHGTGTFGTGETQSGGLNEG